MMNFNSKKSVCKIGFKIPFLSLISFLYVYSLIICLLLLPTSIFGNPSSTEKAWLGVQVQPLNPTGTRMLIRFTQLSRGVIVSEVTKGSPAEQMGIKQNDKILSFNYEDIKNPAEFTDAVSATDPGDRIVLLISRPNDPLLTIVGTMGQSLGFSETEQISEPLEEIKPVITNTSVKIFVPIGEKTVSKIVFSPDGNQILLVSYGTFILWDASTGREIRTFVSDTKQIYSVAFSPDGRYVLSGGKNYSIKLWDVSSGKEIRSFMTSTRTEIDGNDLIQSVAFSPDGLYALSGCSDKTLKLWDIATGREIRTFTGHAGWVKSVAFSPDGRYILSGGDDNFTWLTLPNGAYQEKRSGKNNNMLILWDVVTGKKIRQFKGHTSDVKSVAFSPDGRYVLSESGKVTKIWDVSTGREISTFTLTGGNAFYGFSPDGNYILSTGKNNSIRLWDIATGSEIKTFTGHIGGVYSPDFSNDGKSFISGGKDGSIKLWDIETGKEIAQFISLKDGEWIVITPEGYFNASPNGAKYLNVKVGNKVYAIDNFYEKYYNPVYVASVLQGKKLEPVTDIRDGVALPPLVRIISPETNSELKNEEVTITVSAKDKGGGIDEIRLYHNGKAIGEETRGIKIVPKDNESIKSYTIILVDGLNTFRAIGFSRDRTESNPSEIMIKLLAPEKEISMYVFAVGINKYKNPALNLNYAEPDAKGIADFFRQSGTELFKKVEIRDIYNEQATKEGILAKLKELQNTNPQDAVLIYLAGHGENINEKWYFIPHELTYPEREDDVKEKAISSDELSNSIKNIKAQKVLVMIDACKSGAVLLAFRGFEDRKALSQLSRSTGVHIIAASSKDQFATEVKELGHGVFTYTLLEGLNGKAVQKGEIVTVRKLMSYIEEQLPELTKKYRQEAQYPVVDSRGMDFPLVRGK
ncbi:MAG: caspase family protein [Candidatus Tenebribacter davisii]|nr:caspase family protein [Candidatus Tenebribacter davisii]